MINAFSGKKSILAKLAIMPFFLNMVTYIRECGSTLYVGLTQTTPPISDNFLILPLLLSRCLKRSRSVLRKQIVIKIILSDTVKLVILAAIIFNVLVKTGEKMCLRDFLFNDFVCACVNQLLIRNRVRKERRKAAERGRRKGNKKKKRNGKEQEKEKRKGRGKGKEDIIGGQKKRRGKKCKEGRVEKKNSDRKK